MSNAILGQTAPLPNGDMLESWINFESRTSYGLIVGITALPVIPKHASEGSWLDMTLSAMAFRMIDRDADFENKMNYGSVIASIGSDLPKKNTEWN